MDLFGLKILTKKGFKRLYNGIEEREYNRAVANLVELLNKKDNIYLGGLTISTELYKPLKNNTVFIKTGDGPMITLVDSEGKG